MESDIRDVKSFKFGTHGRVVMTLNSYMMKQPQCLDCGTHASFHQLQNEMCVNEEQPSPETVGTHLTTHYTGRRHRRRCEDCGIHGQRRTLLAYDCMAIQQLRETSPEDVELGRYVRSRKVEQAPVTALVVEPVPPVQCDTGVNTCAARRGDNYHFVRSGV